MLNIARTNDQLQIRFTRLFRDHGLTSPQYNILRILRGEGVPLPILEIASRTITVVPGITGLIDRLVEGGWVTRCRCEEDRRVVRVSITSKGLKTLNELDQPLQELHQQTMGTLTTNELKQISKLLEKVRDGLGVSL